MRAVLVFLSVVTSAVTAGPLDYTPPVDGPIVDAFRPPHTRFGPGNRGIDYGVAPGTPVRTAAPGEVVFAGPVGGDLHVVVLHPDGLRSSYSFLASVAVRRGETVAAGAVLGNADGVVHFGLRDGDSYLDPRGVLAGRRRAQLLPGVAVEAPPEGEERRVLERFVRRHGRPGRRGASPGATWLAASVPEPWRGWLHYGRELTTPVSLRAAGAVAAWADQRHRCSPPDAPPPGVPGRRLAVLVAGLGSTSAHAAVHGVDTRALGYLPDDVVVFSYRGGTTDEQSYLAADTTVDLRRSGERLVALVAALAAAHRGTPVDVIAHSQGGLVARLAVGGGAPAAFVATLGSPHQGADLATAAAMLRAGGLKVGSTSVLQMAESSQLIRALADRALPATLRFLSVAARGDLVVPPPRSYLPGAANVTVTLGPPYATVHRRLPASPQAAREIALARAGRPPTCQALPDVLADHLVGTATSLAQDSLGATLTLAATAAPNLRQ